MPIVYDKELVLRMSMPEPMSGCWIWLGVLQSNGYGTIYVGHQTGAGRIIGAHRYSYSAFRGEIPPGLFACHSCDMTWCVNPGHIFPGTAKDNADDCHGKGRGTHLFGETHGRAKITEATARSIKLHVALGGSNEEIAKAHGCTLAIVRNIRYAIAWRHIAIDGSPQIQKLPRAVAMKYGRPSRFVHAT